MGTWRIDSKRKPGILWLTLEGSMTPEEMKAFIAARNSAIDELAGGDYKIFCDIRQLAPLLPECAEMFERAKGHNSGRPNFRGSAVWVASAIVAMQHRRTSAAGGVIGTELISEDEQALWSHLQKVYRKT